MYAGIRSHGSAAMVAAMLSAASLLPSPGTAQLLGGTGQTLNDAANTINQTAQGTLLGGPGSLLGASATLADTGTLAPGSSGALQASDVTGGIAGLLSGETLHATTIGYPDQIDSEASLAGLALNLGATRIAAGFVMSSASAAVNGVNEASSSVQALTINGLPVNVSGAPNQTIGIPGGALVLNEQRTLADGTLVVNAIHATVNGIADVVVATAMAGWSGGAARAVQASY